MRWQRRARLGVAVFGIVVAGVVFFAFGERPRPADTPPPVRVDPNAVLETARGSMKRVTGTRQDFIVQFERQLGYENGESRLMTVRIEVREKQGRDFLITGAEARANEKTREILLSGDVKMLASDGFELSTATATFRETDGVVRTPGAVSFKKGTMSGTGVGMTYDRNTDVLTIADNARVLMVDEAGTTTGEFSAGAATLARMQNQLQLDRSVHAVRGEQTIDADRAIAYLTDNEEALTGIELRGNSRVAGGSNAFDSMSARDINLDYAEDGTTIERVVLVGNGAIALKGQNGAPGRQMLGESQELALAPDGSLTLAVVRDNVQLVLPGTPEQAARNVRAKALDAGGEPGKGMTSAQFTGDVEYREEAGKDAAARVARSQRLSAALEGDAIRSAIFTGRVQFEEQTLKASAAEAQYEPAKGVLRLRGADEGGGPRVADDRIAIDAETIDVTLEGRQMMANGRVNARLAGGSKTPGLLKKDAPATVTAATLRYDGASGQAEFAETAHLWQGDTSIRGDTITIDQEKGNLSAIGSARSTFTFDGETSVGRADQIRYDDAARQIAYVGARPPLGTVSAGAPGTAAAAAGAPSGARSAPRPTIPGTAGTPSATSAAAPQRGSTPIPSAAPGAASASGGAATSPASPSPSSAAGVTPPAGSKAPGAPKPPGGSGAPAAPAPPTYAQLSGPQGDLRADRIVLVLAKEESRMERLEAYDNVNLRAEARVATGPRLTYLAGEGRYIMNGLGVVPVTISEPCRQTTGRALTFFKATANIIVDGNEEIRTRTTSGGTCPQ